MKSSIIFLLLLSIQQGLAQKEYSNLVSSDKLKEDVQILKSNLEEVHPGLYAYYPKSKLDSVFNDIEESLKMPISSLEFYRKLVPLLPFIANNHTKIECPKSYENAIKIDLPRFPFLMYCRFGKLFVKADHSNEQVIGKGREIVSINGKTTELLLREMVSYYSADGYNTSHTYYGLGQSFSRSYAYYYGTPGEFDIEYFDETANIKMTTIKGIKAPELNQKLGKEKPNKKALSKFEIKEGIAYLKIASFQPESAIKFKKTLKNIFRTIKENATRNLIIDVRGNGGGYGEASSEVLSYLISEVVYPYKNEYALVSEIPYPEFYKKDNFFRHFKKQHLVKKGGKYFIRNISKEKVNPKTDNFTGNLCILLDAASASATGEFLGLVKSYTKAFFYGEEAGGNPSETTANDLLSMTLPNSKVRVTIPALRTVVNINFKNTGHGVRPDFEIIPTIDNILENKDVVLEFTEQQIAKKGLKNK